MDWLVDTHLICIWGPSSGALTHTPYFLFRRICGVSHIGLCSANDTHVCTEKSQQVRGEGLPQLSPKCWFMQWAEGGIPVQLHLGLCVKDFQETVGLKQMNSITSSQGSSRKELHVEMQQLYNPCVIVHNNLKDKGYRILFLSTILYDMRLAGHKRRQRIFNSCTKKISIKSLCLQPAW